MGQSKVEQTQTGAKESRTGRCCDGSESGSANRCCDGAKQSRLDCYCDGAAQRSVCSGYHLVAPVSQPIRHSVNLSQNNAVNPVMCNNVVCAVRPRPTTPSECLPLELATIRHPLHDMAIIRHIVLQAQSVRLSSYSATEPTPSQLGCRTQFATRSLAVPLSRDMHT